MNSFNVSNNEVMKIFCSFRVFEYALWQKAKTRKCRKSAESFLNKKIYQIFWTLVELKIIFHSRKLIVSFTFALNSKLHV